MKEILKQFKNPPAAYRGKPFWAWNSRLQEKQLRRQIRIFHQMGFGGSFLHSRVGLATEYLGTEWFDLTRACIDESKKLQMEAWLYDEDRWPSGPAGGLVTNDPRFQAKVLTPKRYQSPDEFESDNPALENAVCFQATLKDLALVRYKRIDSPARMQWNDTDSLLTYRIQNWPTSSWFNDQTYLDTLSEEAVAEFIRVTHQRYKNEVGEHFGKTVPGMFTDEPNFGFIFRKFWGLHRCLPWTPDLPERCRQLFDIQINDCLPELFYDRADGEFSRPRWLYHLCVRRMFVQAFGRQIGDWCERNNLYFTGHIHEEDPISREISSVGSTMEFYETMNAPGIDLLTQYSNEYLAARQVSSVARQMDRKWVLSELYGCTGWETTFETYKYIGDFQAVLGITLRCPHLSLYSMAGEAKRDYPASIHFHSPWYERYHVLEDYYARLNVWLTQGRPVCDLAVIHPRDCYTLYLKMDDIPLDAEEHQGYQNPVIREMDKKYIALTETLLGSHLDFDFLDEVLLDRDRVRVESDADGPYLRVGSMRYRTLLVPDMVNLHSVTASLLEEFAGQGGKLIFAGRIPSHIDAIKDDRIEPLAKNRTIPWHMDRITAALETARSVSLTDPSGKQAQEIFCQLRRFDQGLILFLVNRNRKEPQNSITMTLTGQDLSNLNQCLAWDAFTAAPRQYPCRFQNHAITARLDLPATGSLLLTFTKDTRNVENFLPQTGAKHEKTLSPGPWEYTLDDENVLVLDIPVSVQAKDISGKREDFEITGCEILEADRQLRNWLGLEPRGGFMVQPWFNHGEPAPDLAQLELTYRFTVEDNPQGPLKLALEQMDTYRILLNGREIRTDRPRGWWVDPAIETVPIDPEMLAPGENSLTLQRSFNRLSDLETVFLLGSFGVQANCEGSALIRRPQTLKPADWCNQGLPFYRGNVTYQISAHLDEIKAQKIFLRIGDHFAAAVEVHLNGQNCGLVFHGDYLCDITRAVRPGQNRIEITLLGSCRNAFGPLHLTDEHPRWVGPAEFVKTPGRWQQDYHLKKYGLFEPPQIWTIE